VIALDTNLLVYAHREDSPWHDLAYEKLIELTKSRAPWAIPWPCLHEFFAIVTHPRIYTPPSPIKTAINQIDAWLEAPNLTLLSESGGYWSELKSLLQKGHITGPQIHDAKIATLCQLNGIKELWTADRDFSRFPNLKTYNPLVNLK